MPQILLLMAAALMLLALQPASGGTLTCTFAINGAELGSSRGTCTGDGAHASVALGRAFQGVLGAFRELQRARQELRQEVLAPCAMRHAPCANAPMRQCAMPCHALMPKCQAMRSC
jgi:hypothetical protein